MDFKKTIGKIIQKERCCRGWTQAKLGKILNLTGKQISIYEKGDVAPSFDTLSRLCDIFACDLGYLLGEEEYSDKTKLNTSITNSLGLSLDAINVIRMITGRNTTDKNYPCLIFKYEGDKCANLMNRLLLSPRFYNFIEALWELDSIVSEKKNLYAAPEREFGKEAVEEMLPYINDYYLTDNPDDISLVIPEYSEKQKEVLKHLNETIDKVHDLEFHIKVARYELHKAFESLADDLYPEN